MVRSAARRAQSRQGLAGKPLAGGARAIWSEQRGDWKYLVETFHFSNYYGSNAAWHVILAFAFNAHAFGVRGQVVDLAAFKANCVCVYLCGCVCVHVCVTRARTRTHISF